MHALGKRVLATPVYTATITFQSIAHAQTFVMPISIEYNAGSDTPLEDERIVWALGTEVQSFHVAFQCWPKRYKTCRDQSVIMHLLRAQASRHLNVYHEPHKDGVHDTVHLTVDKEHVTVSSVIGNVRVGMHDPELAASLWEDLDKSVLSLRKAVTREVARLESERDAWLAHMTKLETAGNLLAWHQEEIESLNAAIDYWKAVDASPAPVIPLTRAEIADGKSHGSPCTAQSATAAADKAS